MPISSSGDSKSTIVSSACLAYVLQTVVHEGLGHGLTAWFSGARQVTMSTVALQSDIGSRWIDANGTVANLVFAAIFWLLLLRAERYGPALRFFFVMAMAGNLFTATGYFFFSGVTNFGDWAQIIHGLHPHWLWQLGLVVVGVISYYAAMLLVTAKLRPFIAEENPRRMRGLTWIPYISEGVLAGIAALPNPAGLFYVIASALPATLGANSGLLAMSSMMRNWRRREEQPIGPIPLSRGWIATATIVSIVFIVIVGRGLTWTR